MSEPQFLKRMDVKSAGQKGAEDHVAKAKTGGSSFNLSGAIGKHEEQHKSMILPPDGFFFIVKHVIEDSIPTIYIALQEDGTAKTINLRLNPQEVRLEIDVLNDVMKMLCNMWRDTYTAQQLDEDVFRGAAQSANPYATTATADPTTRTVTRGELL